jgi:fructokinase
MSAGTRAKPVKARSTRSPVCVGSGFVALDLIFEGKEKTRPAFTFAGGSCGNVLTILSYLAWDAIPVIRLKNDDEARRLVADLERWKVDTRFVHTEPTGTTPVVVQRICTAINGDPYHRFEWKCPSTGLWLPRFRPLPQRLALEISSKLPKPRVFYFDRATRSSLLLAKQAQASGALIFFEPSSRADEKLFGECVAIADVLKYSHERIRKPLRRNPVNNPRLEIITLGEDGLRYRLSDSEDRKWRYLPAMPVGQFKDAAGAGDWCSAGIIDCLARRGRTVFRRAAESTVEKALRYGQSLATINCRYAGARGSMYQLRRAEVDRQVAELLICR